MSDIETAEKLAERNYWESNPAYHILVGDIKARDAAIARAAKVEVFADAYEMLTAKKLTMTLHEAFERLLAKHGITPAELEPVKVYTVGDIKVVEDRKFSPDHGFRITCDKVNWSADGWSASRTQWYCKHDAEAIAAHLRATGNVPGGGA